jgi:hypothetical protein
MEATNENDVLIEHCLMVRQRLEMIVCLLITGTRRYSNPETVSVASGGSLDRVSIAIGGCDFVLLIACQPISVDWIRRQSKRFAVSKLAIHEDLCCPNSEKTLHEYRRHRALVDYLPICRLWVLVKNRREHLQHQRERTPP